MAFQNPKIAALQARMDPNTYVRFWQTPLCKAPCARPGFCCYATFCCYCASYELRKQALYGDMSRYICCNGDCPCSGRLGESSCPSLCLGLETLCCFAMSVASTRYMIQDELLIQTTKCDTCLITTMIVLEYIACVCHIIACITGSEEIRAAAHIVQLIADIMWCSVCGCMQTQHKIELDERNKTPRPAAPMAIHAPVVQTIPVGGYAPYPPQQAPWGGPVYPHPAYPQGPYPPQMHPGMPSPYPQQFPVQAPYSAPPQYAPPPGYVPSPYPYPPQQMGR